MLKQTTMSKGKNAHYHIVYINAKGQGITSLDHEHQHIVEYVIENLNEPVLDAQGQPVVDENGNPQTQQIQQVTTDENGQPKIKISPTDHSHGVKDIVLVEKSISKDTKEEQELEFLELYKRALSRSKDYLDSAKVCEDYYMGNQWSTMDVDILRKKKRAAHTVNKIKPKVDIIAGYQKSNRSELKYIPVEDGDSKIADINTKLAKNITEQTGFEYEESQAFEDALITGLGNLSIYIDYENSLEGDIKIEKYNWADVVYGPHEKLDGSDCEYAVKRKWQSLGYIKKMYPEIKTEVNTMIEQFETLKNQGTSLNDDYTSGDISNIDILREELQSDLVDIASKKIKQYELLKKEYERTPIIFKTEDAFYINGSQLDKELIKKILTINGFNRIDKVFSKVTSSMFIGSILVEEEKDTIFSTLPIVPIYATKKGDRILGKVSGSIECQDEINKRKSHIIDAINRVAYYGTLYEKGAFTGKQAVDFKRNASVPGFTQEVTDLTKIKNLEGTKFPMEILNLYEISDRELNEIIGINPSLLGATIPNETAILHKQRKNQALIGNEYLFDNLNMSNKRIGRLILEALKIYTPERVYRIINNIQRTAQNNNEIVPFNYSMEDIRQIWDNPDLSKYDIIVTENMHSESNRETNFAIWSDLLAKTGLNPQVYLPFLLKLSDAPNREEFMNSIQQTQDQEAQSQDINKQVEIVKSWPDDVKRMQMGLPPEGMTNAQYSGQQNISEGEGGIENR